MYNADPTNMSATQLLAAKSDGFTNVYENGKFTVEKKVKGNMADRDKVFNFRVTFTGIDHMNGKIKVDDEVVDNTNLTAHITNTSTENVDTGVILDNAPYILMLAVVAGGAMMLVIKKRREEE